MRLALIATLLAACAGEIDDGTAQAEDEVIRNNGLPVDAWLVPGPMLDAMSHQLGTVVEGTNIVVMGPEADFLRRFDPIPKKLDKVGNKVLRRLVAANLAEGRQLVDQWPNPTWVAYGNAGWDAGDVWINSPTGLQDTPLDGRSLSLLAASTNLYEIPDGGIDFRSRFLDASTYNPLLTDLTGAFNGRREAGGVVVRFCVGNSVQDLGIGLDDGGGGGISGGAQRACEKEKVCNFIEVGDGCTADIPSPFGDDYACGPLVDSANGSYVDDCVDDSGDGNEWITTVIL